MKKQTELLKAVPTWAVTANIGGATIHGAVSIDDCIEKQPMEKGPWQNYLALIINQITIISLKLLLSVDMHLSQRKSKINNDTVVLGGLALIIVIKDFYQFPPMVGRSLKINLVTSKEIYGEGIWNQFMSVIT